jgi:hypothetical protein
VTAKSGISYRNQFHKAYVHEAWAILRGKGEPFETTYSENILPVPFVQYFCYADYIPKPYLR